MRTQKTRASKRNIIDKTKGLQQKGKENNIKKENRIRERKQNKNKEVPIIKGYRAPQSKSIEPKVEFDPY